MTKRLPFIIAFSAFLAYFPSLFYSFSQDDFIHLSASQAGNIFQFLNFFNPFAKYPDIFFYRPLTTQFYFFLNHSLFGLNALPFHTEGLILHIINSILFYLIVFKIWGNRKLAALSAVLYSISAVHFLSLYFISAFQEVGRAFFMFLSIYTFMVFQDQKRRKYYLISILSFIAALLSKEISITLPFLILVVELFRTENNLMRVFKKTILLLIPFSLILLVYLGLRFFQLQNIFNEGGYNASFSAGAFLQNLKWYILWTFGLPEILSTYPSLKPDSIFQFIKDFQLSGWLILFSVTSLAGIIFVGFSLRKVFSLKSFLLGIIFYLISLAPVLFLEGHRYPYYLNVSLLTIIPVVSFLIIKSFNNRKILAAVLLLSLMAVQFFSIELSRETHWTTHRAVVAQNYFNELKKSHPNLPINSTIIFQGTPESTKELSITLAKHYALNVWYPGKINEVKYQTPDLIIDTPSPVIVPIITY